MARHLAVAIALPLCQRPVYVTGALASFDAILSDSDVVPPLAVDDECLSQDGTACALSAAQLRASAQKLSALSECMPMEQYCGDWPYPRHECCGSNTCQGPYGSIMKCMPGNALSPPATSLSPPPQCVPQEQWCGTWPHVSRECCGYNTCQGGPYGNSMKCLPAVAPAPTPAPGPMCKLPGEVCGGPRQWTLQCCGESRCEAVFGGNGVMKCTTPGQTCKREGEVCGGPGRYTLQCCGDARCETLWGGNGDMKCVRMCKTNGESCSNPTDCCGGSCRTSWLNWLGKTCRSD